MDCPTCGAANLIQDTRDVPYSYKSETTTLRRLATTAQTENGFDFCRGFCWPNQLIVQFNLRSRRRTVLPCL